MKRFLSALLLAAAFGATAQPATPTANIDAAKESAPISPHIYGQFIEHAGDIIYRALWSEMIEDRKFYYAVMLRAPGGNQCPGARPRRLGRRAAAWRRSGKMESHWPGGLRDDGHQRAVCGRSYAGDQARGHLNRAASGRMGPQLRPRGNLQSPDSVGR
jgi:hypothetical protein